MSPDIGRPGDRQRVYFGNNDTSEKEQEQKETFEQHGFDGFEEDMRGINHAVKLRHVMQLALEQISLAEISEATNLRVRFLKRCIQYHGLEDYDAIGPQKSPPWEPRPRDDVVAKGSGQADRTPWNE